MAVELRAQALKLQASSPTAIIKMHPKLQDPLNPAGHKLPRT